MSQNLLLHMMSSSAPSTPAKSTFDTGEIPSVPNLITFINNVPPQLTLLLVELGPHIARLRWCLEAISWKSSFPDSWLFLCGWWALCLLWEISFRYLLLLVAASLYVYLSVSSSSRTKSTATEQSLQSTVIDLSVIESLLPSSPKPPILHWKLILRAVAILYIPYLLVTWLVGLKVLVAAIGSVVIVWRARWATTIRAALWRSSWFRLGLRKSWALLSGQSGPTVLSPVSVARFEDAGHTIRFLITIQENQRWWVGLDWTSALLPGERPIWCSATLDSLPPPSNFVLPEPTCVFIGDGKGGLVKRTASWVWEEEEWKVIVRKEVGTRRVEKELPVLKEDTSAHTNRLGRAKQKVYEATARLKKSQEGDSGDAETMPVSAASSTDSDAFQDEDVTHAKDEDECYTDSDGWVYGDNKWKATSSSGGLGKYTRFRKWTRIAILMESIEPASVDEARDYAAKQHEAANAPTESRMRAESISGSRASVDSIGRPSLEENDEEDTGLRNRLKAAIRKSTTIS